MNEKNQNKKRSTGIIAVVLAFLILLTGTFAWYYITNAVNEFSGKKDIEIENSAVLHDDFEEEGQEDNDGNVVHNKDVYVENTGDDSIFVRIRLDEYMEIDEESIITGVAKDDMDTWKTHKPTSDVEECAEEFHDYWEWEMGGTTEYIKNAKGAQGVISRYDNNGNDTLTIGDPTNEKTQNGTATTVITMAEYKQKSEMEKEEFFGWIYDTDGYAYWSQKLVPNEATGLLLNKVTLLASFVTANGEEEYYYAINVVMETVDEKDVTAWINGTRTSDGKDTKQATDDAQELLKFLSERYTKITDDMKTTIPPADKYDKDGDGYLIEEELQEYLKDQKEIVVGEDGKYYRPRPDLDNKGGKGSIYEEIDSKGEPLNPERIIDSGVDGKPGTSDDEEWTKITDDMNAETPPARDYDEYNKDYLTPDEMDKWQQAVEEEKIVGLKAIALAGTQFAGDPLSTEEIEVKVVYEDNSEKTVTSGYSAELSNGATELSEGANEVIVTYTKEYSQDELIANTQVTGVKVIPTKLTATKPTKDNYIVGEEFDPTGMTVTAEYNKASLNGEVTDYACSPEEFETAGESIPVTISYTYNNVKVNTTVYVSVISLVQEQIESIADKEIFDDVTIGDNTWIIMSKNTSAGQAELLSKDCVGKEGYHSAATGWRWSTSDVRNNYLKKTYFNSLPQELRNTILSVRKPTNLPSEDYLTKSGDTKTDETVYLLSKIEYDTYKEAFKEKTGEDLYCYGITTDIYDSWWLRTPYTTISGTVYAMRILTSNGANTNGVGMSGLHGIRPAITVKYK